MSTHFDVNRLSQLTKRERRILSKALEQLDQKPPLESSDERITDLAGMCRDVAAEEEIAVSDVITTLGAALKLHVVIKKGEKTIADSANGIDPHRRSAKKIHRHLPAKYMNPENHDQTYTGKGPVPNWLKAKIADGQTKEDFLIAPGA